MNMLVVWLYGFWEVLKTPSLVSYPVLPILLPHWLLKSIFFSLSLPSLIISLLDYCLTLLLQVTPPVAFPCLQKNV